jgi:hypothetical protein
MELRGRRLPAPYLFRLHAKDAPREKPTTIFCYYAVGRDARSSFGRVVASGPDRVWPVRAAHAPVRGRCRLPTARNSNVGTAPPSATEEVFPISNGNIWQSALCVIAWRDRSTKK